MEPDADGLILFELHFTAIMDKPKMIGPICRACDFEKPMDKRIGGRYRGAISKAIAQG